MAHPSKRSMEAGEGNESEQHRPSTGRGPYRWVQLTKWEEASRCEPMHDVVERFMRRARKSN